MTLPRYRPMLATPWPAAFDDDGWQFEPKWDGIRALVACDGDRVEVRGRRGDEVTARYPEITAGRGARRPCVLDGEIVAFDDSGLPSFERLQRRIHVSEPGRAVRLAGEVPVTFVAFDLLHDGEPLLDVPLADRRARLESLEGTVTVTTAVVGRGTALWAAVTERHLEGIVAKRLDSPYRPGARSADWRKVSHLSRVRAVVGGFTPGEGGRSGSFGALLLGLWDGDRLRFVGAVGTGFDELRLGGIGSALGELETPVCPFHPGGLPAGSRWVEPSLVAVVGMREWTSAGRLRQPRFLGFAADPHDTVTWDDEGPGTDRPASPQ